MAKLGQHALEHQLLAQNGNWLVPAGVIMLYAGAAAPVGWLICSGQTVPQVTYPNLWSAIGTTWGSIASGIVLPNLVDSFPVGAGNLYGVGTHGGATTGGATTTTGYAVNSNESTTHYHSVTSSVSASVPAHYHSSAATGATIAIVNGSFSSGYEIGEHSHDEAIHRSGNEAAGYSLWTGGNGFGDRVMVTGDSNSPQYTINSPANNHYHTTTVGFAHASFSGTVGLVTGGSNGDAAFAATVTNNAVNTGTEVGTHTHTDSGHTHSVTVATVPPYQAVYYIIKY